MAQNAKISVADEAPIELETITGTEGERAIVIKPLRASSGLITLDPGFVNTGSCTSSITFIDGAKGILRYRGYPIEQLARQSTFTEVCHLLTEGALPTKEQLDAYELALERHSLIHENIKGMLRSFPLYAHPMAILSSLVCALSTFYQDEYDPLNAAQVRINTIRLLAKLPTVAAFSFKQSRGQAFIYPDNRLSYAGRLLKMLFAYRSEPYVVDEDVERAVDQLLILHADHEQNCSTTAVRIAGSSQVNMFASISAGICALWGPLHGGANQAVLEMLERIRQDDSNVAKYVEMARDKSSGFRLMGFGHRVYKSFDPRATILREACDRVLKKLQIADPLLEVAKRLEEVALEDSYFKERDLYPNVDFYSGIIYRALGIPTNMFTVMFALGRLPGWIAQYKENLEHGNPIGRPRQIYTGSTARDYVPVDQRSA
jgi:citrate synthase